MLPAAFVLFALPMALVQATNSRTTTAYPAPTTGAIGGTGRIRVIVDTAAQGTLSFTTAAVPAGIVGCLDATGRVVGLGDYDDDDKDKDNAADNCALFTSVDYVASTTEGACSFFDKGAPMNADFASGMTDGLHAFSCWEHAAVSSDTDFYTISGLAYNFIGHGDIQLYYDIPSLPESSTDAVSLWPLAYSGATPSVPTGHYMALLLWEPAL